MKNFVMSSVIFITEFLGFLKGFVVGVEYLFFKVFKPWVDKIIPIHAF